MTRTLDVELRPSRHRVLERVKELTRSDQELQDRLEAVKEFSASVRSAEVFITNACNLRCKGCWFFEHDMDKAAEEVRDLDTLRTFAQQLHAGGTTNVLLIGGEPALVPDRISVFVETFPYVSVVTNGTRPVPYDGFENIQVLVSLWGGGPIDDALRGHRPNGQPITGLFDLGLGSVFK
ncbi:radical SAM protein [Streptomyces tauricus]|uniref:Radical SAM protein n=1 Tax=Streptomyces tauricus TaxID=68274 RepID=A0ABZ1JSQ6_9ACTN|nr:radical SAM protein [Streptomyces tauricus]